MQDAVARYIEDEKNYINLPNFYQEKRDYFLAQIKDSRFEPLPCLGTYFMLLDYSKISNESDVTFAERMTIEHGLATIPVSVFNKSKRDDKVVRVCFAKTNEVLDQASDIIRKTSR